MAHPVVELNRTRHQEAGFSLEWWDKRREEGRQSAMEGVRRDRLWPLVEDLVFKVSEVSIDLDLSLGTDSVYSAWKFSRFV